MTKFTYFPHRDCMRADESTKELITGALLLLEEIGTRVIQANTHFRPEEPSPCNVELTVSEAISKVEEIRGSLVD